MSCRKSPVCGTYRALKACLAFLPILPVLSILLMAFKKHPTFSAFLASYNATKRQRGGREGEAKDSRTAGQSSRFNVVHPSAPNNPKAHILIY